MARCAQIAAERGLPGVLDFLRDLHDDPQPSFVVKMVLAVRLASFFPSYPAAAELTVPPSTGIKCTRAHLRASAQA